jgi:hypothetical protein
MSRSTGLRTSGTPSSGSPILSYARWIKPLQGVDGWVYAAAAVIVIGSLPVLSLNIARVGRREWKRDAPASTNAALRDSPGSDG